MDHESKKRALGEYIDAKKELEYWRERVEQLAALDVYRSPGISPTPGGKAVASKTEIAVLELESAEESERAAAARASEAHARVLRIINTAPTGEQRVLLMRRYIEGMTWDEIAAVSRKSRTWCTNLHGTALKLVQLPGGLDCAKVDESVRKC